MDEKPQKLKHQPGPGPAKDQVWFIIPAYNEGEMIGKVVGEVLAHYKHIVVVDDGSTDNTAQSARLAGAILVRHPMNMGQGAALKTGIDFALEMGCKYVVTYDADGQHDVDDVANMLCVLQNEDLDIVVGSRFLGNSPGLPVSRKFVLKLAVVFSNLTSGTRLTDAHNGLRLMTAETAGRLQILQNRMAHASEITGQLSSLGLKYREVPVTIRYTEYSLTKGQKIHNVTRILADLIGSVISR